MKTGIVVILYNPDIGHLTSVIQAFSAPEWDLVLVDNSANANERLNTSSCTYIHCGTNLGIAKAQNIGLEKLFDKGVEYAFLLDQDSQFTPTIANELLRQFTTCLLYTSPSPRD